MSADAKKRVLIVANELSPYVEDTVFAPILNMLSRKTFDSGVEIRVIMPRFGTINERRHRLHEVVRLSGINIVVDKDDYPLVIKVASLPNARLQVYFMDNEDYFKRKFTARDESGKFYDDNAERMVFFCKSAIETVKKFGWPPHLIHCHGWMTSLLPVYLKTAYKKEPVFNNSKIAFTVQNPQFSESLSTDFVKKAMVNGDLKEKDLEAFRSGTADALTLGAMKASDILLQGEPTLPAELEEAMKPSRTKRVVRWEDSWAEDVSPLLNLYKNLVEFPVKA